MMSNIFPDAFVIAVVIFATNISVSVMFAKKRGYTVEPNQVRLYYKSSIVSGLSARVGVTLAERPWGGTRDKPKNVCVRG